MLLEIIHDDTEKKLLSDLETASSRAALRSAFHFHSSKLKVWPSEEEVLVAARPALRVERAAIYFFQDHDLLTTWNGLLKEISNDLCNQFYTRFHPKGARSMHTCFDLTVQHEELRKLCEHKLEVLALSQSAPTGFDISPQPQENERILLPPPPDKLAQFAIEAESRPYRSIPVVLIVEDTRFYRQHLRNLLRRSYIVEAAENAEQGLNLYLEFAPDIVFLDIGLPDSTGHALTEIINQIDPQAFIVMVTGNNHIENVTRAQKNGVKGFIAKPFSNQKILDSIERFYALRKLRRISR